MLFSTTLLPWLLVSLTMKTNVGCVLEVWLGGWQYRQARISLTGRDNDIGSVNITRLSSIVVLKDKKVDLHAVYHRVDHTYLLTMLIYLAVLCLANSPSRHQPAATNPKCVSGQARS